MSCLTAILVACVASSRGSAVSTSNVDATGTNGFYLLYGRDTMVEEHYSRSAARIEGRYFDRVRGARVRYVASIAGDGRIDRLQTTSSRPGAADTVRDITWSGDTLRVQENGGVRRVGGAGGAQIILGPSGAMIEQLIVRARRVTAQRTASGAARDTVTLRTVEASSGRSVGTLAIRWFGNDSASATVPGIAGVTGLVISNGMLVRVHYGVPAGMRLVRMDSRR